MRSSRTHILYVEDDDDIRDVAMMSLEIDPDLEVRSCASGSEALEVARSWVPDLILLDVMMPHMDGPATLEALRQISGLEKVPVVFLSARTQAAEQEHLRQLGARGVIAKPFDPLTLAREVRAFVA